MDRFRNEMAGMQACLDKSVTEIELKSAELKTTQDSLLQAEATVASLSDNIAVLENSLEQQNMVITSEKKGKLNAQKRASKWKLKYKDVSEGPSQQQLAILNEHIQAVEHENDTLKERINEFLSDSSVQTFKNGTYSDEIRQVYMDLLANGVSVRNCETVIKTVLTNLTKKEIDRLPQKSLASMIEKEASILAKRQAGEAMLLHSTNTLHLDGTKKKFTEYAAIETTTGDGKTLSLGFKEMEGGDTDSYLEAVRNLISEIATLLCPADADTVQKCAKVAELTASLKNTMTDRHIVNKCFNDQFSQWRKELLPLFLENLEILQTDQLNDIVRMNNLFCGAHVIINLGTVAKSAVKEFENIAAIQLQTNGFKNVDGSRTVSILLELSKAFCRGHNYQKAGAVSYWQPYLDSIDVKNEFVSFRGERINILFVNAAAAYFHKEHVIEFVRNHSVQQNLLLDATTDIEQVLIQACCRALGIMGKLVTGPLFRLLSGDGHIFSLNHVWQSVKEELDQLSLCATPLMEQKEVVPGGIITKDKIYEALFAETSNSKLDSLTEQCLRLLCCTFSVLIGNQLCDQLEGGKFFMPSAQVMEETKFVPKTNLDSERDFAQLDRQLSSKPNISVVSLSGLICFKNNQTSAWLKSLPEADRKERMAQARRLAPQVVQQYKKEHAKIAEQKVKMMADKKSQREKKVEKCEQSAELLTARLTLHGGLWSTVAEMKANIDHLSHAKQKVALADQLRFRKTVLKMKHIDKSLLALQNKNGKYSHEQLYSNMMEILSATPHPTESNAERATELRSSDTCANMVAESVRKRKADGEAQRTKTKSAKKPKIIDFTGRNILHRWIDENNKHVYYPGKVIQPEGSVQDPKCTYQVVYSNEPDQPYDVCLYEDYVNGDIAFPPTHIE